MSEDYRDNMTLDEMGANDIEMAKDAIKKAKRYKFFTAIKAVHFMQRCIIDTLAYLGIKGITPNTHPKVAQRMMDSRQIVIETRTRYEGEDVWRNGTYIYKKGELVTFISEVMVAKSRQSPIILPGTIPGDPDKFHVITNAKVK